MKKEYRVIGVNYEHGLTCSHNIIFNPNEENPSFALAKIMKMNPNDFDEVLVVSSDLELKQFSSVKH